MLTLGYLDYNLKLQIARRLFIRVIQV